MTINHKNYTKHMEKRSKQMSVGAIILASAIIWGAVIVGCAFALKGTECYQNIQLILFGGIATHLILIWTPMGLLVKKLKEGKNGQKESAG
jgi:hypothetical protein